MIDRKNRVIWSHDPSGNVFLRDGVVFRRINVRYALDYAQLMGSGLYDRLVKDGLLVAHEELAPEERDENYYKLIRPEQIPFISYPYEWCFGQLKAAALATLAIQKTALQFGMTLKDSSAFNIQFRNGKPVLIDTLSFEKYLPGSPWVAYRQFCQYFIAPLVLMRYKDPRLSSLFRSHHDGIPLDLASALLPRTTYLRPSVFSHIHFHAWMQKACGSRPAAGRRLSMSRFALDGLIDNLESVVRGLKIGKPAGGMADYYDSLAPYTDEGMRHKKATVGEFLDMVRPRTVWDFGGNTGIFSRIAAGKGARVVSFDNDHGAVEENYRICLREGAGNVLPLYIDVVNYSPLLGWASEEKMSFTERGPVDLAMALALVHHLAVGYAIPWGVIADFFARICGHLVIEFVPKDDPTVRGMLVSREDIFDSYTRDDFERAFARHFSVLKSAAVRDSGRVIYLMKRL